MSLPNDVHQVVIIGASFGGLTTAQGLLKDVLPAVSSARKQKFKVVMIGPNDLFYWKIAAPRVIVKPDVLPIEKLLLPIADAFKQYPTDQFEFIRASATSIDPTQKTVFTSIGDSVHYDSLVIASGTTFSTSAWTISNGVDALRASVAEINEQLPRATSILVAGGGAVGTETAGEVADVYGGKKDITLLSGSIQLLPRLKNKNVGKDAEARLTKLGVKVIHDIRVTSHNKMADGKTTLKLSDGTEKVVDVYVQATGDRPNNSFVPEAWLDAKGFVKTDGPTLRVDVPNLENVYCVGSVGSYSDGSLFAIKNAMKSLMESMRLDLMGKRETSSSVIASSDPTSRGWINWLTSWIPFYGSTENGPRKIFYKTMPDTQLVPIGLKQGVAVAFGWKLPGLVTVMAKSKDFMLGNAPKVLAGTF